MSQKLNSVSPAPDRELAEMNLQDLILVMRSINIMHETVEGKPYAIRFVGSPFNHFVEECRSLQILAHQRGTRISPHHIRALLAKFDISEQAFFDALDAYTTPRHSESWRAPSAELGYDRPN